MAPALHVGRAVQIRPGGGSDNAERRGLDVRRGRESRPGYDPALSGRRDAGTHLPAVRTRFPPGVRRCGREHERLAAAGGDPDRRQPLQPRPRIYRTAHQPDEHDLEEQRLRPVVLGLGFRDPRGSFARHPVRPDDDGDPVVDDGQLVYEFDVRFAVQPIPLGHGSGCPSADCLHDAKNGLRLRVLHHRQLPGQVVRRNEPNGLGVRMGGLARLRDLSGRRDGQRPPEPLLQALSARQPGPGNRVLPVDRLRERESRDNQRRRSRPEKRTAELHLGLRRRHADRDHYDELGRPHVRVPDSEWPVCATTTATIVAPSGNLPPVATLDYQFPSGLTHGWVNQSIRFSVTVRDPEGNPLSIQWDFGDGATASNASTNTATDQTVVQVHTYSQPGDYTLTVTVTDSV